MEAACILEGCLRYIKQARFIPALSELSLIVSDYADGRVAGAFT
jgi:hypothetical protein